MTLRDHPPERSDRHRPRTQKVRTPLYLLQAALAVSGGCGAASAAGRGLRPLLASEVSVSKIGAVRWCLMLPRWPRTIRQDRWGGQRLGAVAPEGIQAGRSAAGHCNCGTWLELPAQPSRVRSAGLRPPLTAACCGVPTLPPNESGTYGLVPLSLELIRSKHSRCRGSNELIGRAANARRGGMRPGCPMSRCRSVTIRPVLQPPRRRRWDRRWYSIRRRTGRCCPRSSGISGTHCSPSGDAVTDKGDGGVGPGGRPGSGSQRCWWPCHLVAVIENPLRLSVSGTPLVETTSHPSARLATEAPGVM